MIIIISFGCLVNQLYSHYTNEQLEVERPSIHLVENERYNIHANSPFIVAEGLELPIRLGRLSGKGPSRRLTNVIDESAKVQQVFYAVSKFTHVNDAIRNLRKREGISLKNKRNIGIVDLTTNHIVSRSTKIANKIKKWAIEQGYSIVIWTDLPKKGVKFKPESDGEEILPLLENDAVLLTNTQDYIRSLPFNTPLHDQILNMR